MEINLKSEIGKYELSIKQKLVIQASIIILGTIIRLYVYSTRYAEPTDILGYMHNARFLLGREDEYEYPKEIGYPFFLALVGSVFGLSYRVARVSSILIGIINIPLSAKTARTIMKRWGYSEDFSYNASLFVSFLVSITATIFKSDNLGVREPLYTLLLLSLMIFLHNQDTGNRTLISIFILTLSLGLVKTEFQYIGIGLALLLYIESAQQGYQDFKRKSILIFSGAVMAFIFWHFLSSWLMGNDSTTSNFYINAIVDLLDPTITPGEGWSWLIFSYLGVPKFIFYLVSGAYKLIIAFPDMVGLTTFVLVVIGGKEVIKSSRITIPLLYIGVVFFNGLVAYATNLVGLDRIVSVYFPLIFVYAGISVMKIKSFNIKITPSKNLQLPSYISLLFVTLLVFIESVVWYFAIAGF